MSSISQALQLLKVLRGGPLDSYEVGFHAGLSRNTVRAWLREAVAEGFVAESTKRADLKPGTRGNPVLYSVAPAWMGPRQ